MNQFSFAFNPRKTVGECETAAKESGISTTQKTDSYKMKESGQADWSFPTITSRKGLTHQSQNIQDISRENKGEKVFNLLSLLP